LHTLKTAGEETNGTDRNYGRLWTEQLIGMHETARQSISLVLERGNEEEKCILIEIDEGGREIQQ
jgi:hypothetical protein